MTNSTSSALPPSAVRVVEQVRAAAHAYEDALVAGDGEAAGRFFSDAESVSRFGPEGAQYGPAMVHALRSSYPPVDPPQWLYDEVVPIGATAAVHKAVMLRGDTVVQRTQVWELDEHTGWSIVHAHVSRLTDR